MNQQRRRKTAPVLVVFGTRPEIIKLTPVLREMARHPCLRTVTVASAQQADLLPTFLRSFAVEVDHDLDVMVADQPLNQLLARLLAALDPVVEAVAPALTIVQGDTTTALAGAVTSRLRGVPVAHVEAGLRSGDTDNPFPEELNRRLITQAASLHLAATRHNVETLVEEGVAAEDIVLTGNPVIDSLNEVLAAGRPAFAAELPTDALAGKRIILLTHHRRDNFGPVMEGNLRAIRDFAARHDDVAVVFPVHPNPAVRRAAEAILQGAPRVHRIAPLDYPDFIDLMRRAWLVVTDSGGLQEEAPTLGKPVLILRRTTERPEAIDCGIARLIDGGPEHLARELDAIDADRWPDRIGPVDNPFGHGDSGHRIAEAVAAFVARHGATDAEEVR